MLCIENAGLDPLRFILLNNFIKMTNKKMGSKNDLINKSQSPMEESELILVSDRGAIRLKRADESVHLKSRGDQVRLQYL